MLNKNSINCRHLLLGLLLNILVIIVFLLIYHAYIISPKLEVKGGEMMQNPAEEVNLP